MDMVKKHRPPDSLLRHGNCSAFAGALSGERSSFGNLTPAATPAFFSERARRFPRRD
jgi:hypothetical protein